MSRAGASSRLFRGLSLPTWCPYMRGLNTLGTEGSVNWLQLATKNKNRGGEPGVDSHVSRHDGFALTTKPELSLM